ncbi:MAG: response regulator [Lachnospiraceae bacterium]
MKRGKLTGIDVVKCFFIVAFLGVCLYFILGELLLEADVPDNEYKCEAFDVQWSMVKGDGTRIPIEIPAKCDVERNEIVTIEAQMPAAIDAGAYLCFRSLKQDMKIYVDGNLRQEYSTENTRLFGKTGAVVYVFMELQTSDAGKTITVTTQTDSSYSGIFQTIYYGDKMGIWHYFFQQCGAELMIAFLTLFLGAASIVGSIALRISYRRKVELEYLGWGVFLAAVWLIANSVFRQLLFPNISVINDLTFYMIMLFPIPFMIYMNEVQRERYQKAYLFAGCMGVVDFIVCTILHLTHQKDFADTIVFMVAVCFLSILVMGVTTIIDICRGYIKEYYLVAVGILGASIAACGQIVMYFRRTALFNGVMLALGLLFLLIVCVINTIHNILYLESEKRRAELASEAKARFLANMSHEIRTPINAVLGMDAMILRECEDMQIKEYALDIQNAGQNLLALVNDILDLSKIESGKMEIIPAEYDFSSMIHDIVNMVSMKVQEKNLNLEVSVDQTLPSRLYGDEIRVRQILINILNNAVKYTNEGSVKLSVGGRTEEERVLLEFVVEDTGIGIKEEDLSKLFAEFERIEEERNRNVEGTGLGMSITAQLLKMMDSELKVESVYGEGSKFSFTLAQKVINREPIGNLEARIKQQTVEYTYHVFFTAPTAQILMVDDNVVNRKVFVNLLKSTKVNVDLAESGMECLEKVCEKHYDLIFLDHMMPEMDGIETLHRMKEMKEYPCKDTPVIALTANAITGAREMYLSEGFDNFLSKPIVPEKLEQMMQKLLPQEMVVLQKDDGAQQEKHSKAGEKGNLPTIEGVDWNYALMHFSGEDDLLETVYTFYRVIDSEADYLEQRYDDLFRNEVAGDERENALDLYRIKVHAMKGSAALIGMLELSGTARVLEYAARDKNMEIIRALTPVFLKEWRGYRERLKPCVPKEEEKQAIADYREILSQLEVLGEAMEDLDIDLSDQIMKQLRKFDYPQHLQELIDKLDDAVINLDSDAAGLLIEKILTQIEQ